jgi:hypothetical protein
MRPFRPTKSSALFATSNPDDLTKPGDLALGGDHETTFRAF